MPYARGPQQNSASHNKKKTDFADSFQTIEEAGRESLKEAFPEDSGPGLRARTHWRCTGGVLLGEV